MRKTISRKTLRISPERDFVFPSERNMNLIYLFILWRWRRVLETYMCIVIAVARSMSGKGAPKGKSDRGWFRGSSVDGPSNKTRRDGLSAWLTRRYSWSYYRFLKISLHLWSCATSISTLRIRVAHATWPSREMRRRASTHVYVCAYMWHVRVSKYCTKKREARHQCVRRLSRGGKRVASLLSLLEV